ncbi:hypothetical protein [Nitrosomonas sp. ANs5]|uniref:hypothetical protein n=1 Tax=Nitrosomonas sp. ANs5 TaxID=3423941 RepID=UPI003D327ACC
MHRFAGGYAVVVAFGGVVDGVWRCTGAPTRAIQLSGVFVPDWVGVALGQALADAGEP